MYNEGDGGGWTDVRCSLYTKPDNWVLYGCMTKGNLSWQCA